MSSINGEETDMYTKMLFGENAMRGIGHMIVQAATGSEKLVSICGTFVGIQVPYETHDYYECEIIIRPVRKISTSEYKGQGLTGAAQEILQKQINIRKKE